jgi:hypothetical protein
MLRRLSYKSKDEGRQSTISTLQRAYYRTGMESLMN